MPHTNTLPTPRMTTLTNGVRVVTQNITGMQSAAIGIRIDSSTRNEPPGIGGASHFIEHLLFKGTEKRSADRIMEEFDALGACANAYTSQEEVFYYASSLASAIPATFDLLADLFVNSTMPVEEVEKERDVVLQEIAMTYDNPSRYVYRQFHSGFWKNHPLGLCVLGSSESIGAIRREQLLDHKQSQYVSGAAIVAAAGNVEHEKVVELSNRLLDRLPGGAIPRATAEPGWQPATREYVHHHRSMEQTQFYMGYPIPPADNEHRHTLAVLNQILGSGMSSRLFREVRERRGLAYAVYSSMLSYSDAASLLIFAGTSPERAQEAINVCHAELLRFCGEKVTEETLASAKEQIRCKRLMALDDCDTQIRRIAATTSILGEPEPIRTALEGVAAVNADQVRSLAESLFANVIPRVESVGPGDGPVLPR